MAKSSLKISLKSHIVSNQPMKSSNNVLGQKCSYCGSTRLEEDEDMVKCLDCGMGLYKEGKIKRYSK